MKAGSDVPAIIEEWGDEFQDLEMAEDWALKKEEFVDQSRWCTHWRKVVKHSETGMTIAIEYARNVGDSDSASAYETKWYEVEESHKTISIWTQKEGGAEGTVPSRY